MSESQRHRRRRRTAHGSVRRGSECSRVQSRRVAMAAGRSINRRRARPAMDVTTMRVPHGLMLPDDAKGRPLSACSLQDQADVRAWSASKKPSAASAGDGPKPAHLRAQAQAREATTRAARASCWHCLKVYERGTGVADAVRAPASSLSSFRFGLRRRAPPMVRQKTRPADGSRRAHASSAPRLASARFRRARGAHARRRAAMRRSRGEPLRMRQGAAQPWGTVNVGTAAAHHEAARCTQR